MQVHKGHHLARQFFTGDNARSYDAIVNFATLGQDKTWKKAIISHVSGDRILELACGTGILSSLIGQGSGRLVAALDLSYEYLQLARENSILPLLQGNAETLPCRDSTFDVVVSSYLAKYVNLDLVCKECFRVLAHGGIAIFHDFAFPQNGTVVRLWDLHFGILRLLGNFVPQWKVVFRELQSTIRNSAWAVSAVEALCNHGFVDITFESATFGTAVIISGKKP